MNRKCINYELNYDLSDNYTVCNDLYEPRLNYYILTPFYLLVDLVCKHMIVLNENDVETRSFAYNKPTYSKTHWNNSYGLKIKSIKNYKSIKLCKIIIIRILYPKKSTEYMENR